MSPKSIDSIYSSRISAREQHFNYSAQWKWVRVSDVSWWIHCEIYNWCGSHSCTRRKSKGNREKRREKRRLRRFVKTRFIAKLILEEWNTPFPAKRNQFMNEKTKNKNAKTDPHHLYDAHVPVWQLTKWNVMLHCQPKLWEKPRCARTTHKILISRRKK